MKLALITPKRVFFSTDPGMMKFFSSSIKSATNSFLLPQQYGYWSGGSLGLLIVAALTPSNFQIDFIDENYEDINFDKHYDVVGITAMTQQAKRSYEIADEFRRRGVSVVVGGIHATVLPEEAKEHADSVIIGEAETTWPAFIDDFQRGMLKPFYKSAVSADLTKAPVPRYELLKKYDYKMIWVQTTRGCPRDCEFCAASKVYGKSYRHKTIEQVLKEIDYVKNIWPEPVINFADDNMFVDKKYSYELAERMGRKGLRWTAQTDVSVADDDTLLDLLRKNGCMLLFIGFETLSKNNQLDKHGWKQNKIQRYPEVIRKIQSKGIGILGAFIIGLDEDDRSVARDMSDFIIENHLYAAQIMILTPVPGTRLRERLLRENRVLSNDWGRYTFLDVNFMPKRMKPEDLQKSLLEIYKRVYSKDARMAVVKYFKDIYANLQRQEAQVGGSDA